MPKTVKVSRAPQAREKYVKVMTRREQSGAGRCALARPKRKLVKVAPGYLRKRVKVASQRDRHKMVKVSEGAENIPPPY